MKKPRYGYMCQVDFDHELGEAYPFTEVYPSIKTLKEQRKCVKDCGIYKVKVEVVKVVQKGTGWKTITKEEND